MRGPGTIACFLALSVAAAGDDAAKKWSFVDIQDKANAKMADDQGQAEGNHLKNVPQGEETLGDAKFKIGENYIHLKGEHEPDLPEKVEGIKVGAAFETLHILHSTGNGEGKEKQDDGSEIGSYVVHYADKTEAKIPILYGEDLRDWWDWPDRPDVTRAKVAWTGSNDYSAQNGRKIRLYSIAWKNPHPDKTVTSIDYTSANTHCDPFLIALSLEGPK
jgi:hypothetical protein